MLRSPRSVAAFVSVILVAAACGPGAAPPASPADDPTNDSASEGTELVPSPTPPSHVSGASEDTVVLPDTTEPDEPASERTIFAGVNIAIADVPLDEIVFDTFDGGQISLVDAPEELVESLLNVIRPLDDPAYIAGSTASYLQPNDIVLGYVADDGTAWAHPHRVMNFHEIVNTELAGLPVAITYCPLCGSGVVFDRRPVDLRHEGVLTFDNTSALYENDMVMVDAETNTYWWQVAGRGIVGNLTGTELISLPSTTTSWATWLETHPETVVLSNDQGRGPSYVRDPFVDYGTSIDAGRLQFPVGPEAFEDKRLSPSTRVIGFEVGGEWAAVPVLANTLTAIAVPGDDPLVVFLDGAGGGSVFRSDSTWSVGDEGFVDAAGTTWDLAGRSADGGQLEAAPSRTAFWFAWISTTGGDTRLFGPDGEVS